MTKQRLAEIMKEIDDGSEELVNKGVSVLLSVGERKDGGTHIVLLGSTDEDYLVAEKIALSMLHTAWEKGEEDIPFEDYIVRFSSAAMYAYRTGELRGET